MDTLQDENDWTVIVDTMSVKVVLLFSAALSIFWIIQFIKCKPYSK